jgi:hypothetical protein
MLKFTNKRLFKIQSIRMNENQTLDIISKVFTKYNSDYRTQTFNPKI